MSIVIGVDGGNTKTIALAARLDGTIVGTGRSGCGDIYNKGEEAAVTSVIEAISGAVDQAGAAISEIAAVTLSLAGADWPEDMEFWQATMRERGIGQTVLVVNDAMGALRAGSPDGSGVAIVCGTGAGTGAKSPDGRIWHSSFWQMTQGAEEMSRKVRKAIYLAELGIAPPTTLTQRALDAYNVPTVEAILHTETGRDRSTPTPIGKLSRALMEEARAGDAVAVQIVREHGIALADYGLVAARKVGIDGTRYPLILTGSVLRAPDSPLAAVIVEHMRASSPDLTPIFSRYEPAIGTLFLALEAAGIAIDDALLTHVEASLPPAHLYET